QSMNTFDGGADAGASSVSRYAIAASCAFGLTAARVSATATTARIDCSLGVTDSHSGQWHQLPASSGQMWKQSTSGFASKIAREPARIAAMATALEEQKFVSARRSPLTIRNAA